VSVCDFGQIHLAVYLIKPVLKEGIHFGFSITDLDCDNQFAGLLLAEVRFVCVSITPVDVVPAIHVSGELLVEILIADHVFSNVNTAWHFSHCCDNRLREFLTEHAVLASVQIMHEDADPLGSRLSVAEDVLVGHVCPLKMCQSLSSTTTAMKIRM